MNRSILTRVFSVVSVALVTISTPLVASADEGAGSWADSMVWSGDLRLRYEGIDEQDVANRDRARYRARVGFSAKLNDDLKVVIGLASGAYDPVSRNQTFGNGFSSKDFGMELAYVDWTALENLHVFAGKMKNPLFIAGKNSVMWDGDLNPEGLALQYKSGIFFANAISFLVSERSAADNSTLMGAQGGVNLDVGPGKLTAGVGLYDYSNTVGNLPFYNAFPRGNSVDANGRYMYDYRELEGSVEYKTEVADLPLTVFADWVRNTEVDQQDSAYSFGVALGSAKNPGESQVSWAYHDIEADALIGTFNDSDFGGGGTDVKGHFFKGKYVLRNNVALGLTYILSDTEVLLNKHDYSRYQLDIEFKF